MKTKYILVVALMAFALLILVACDRSDDVRDEEQIIDDIIKVDDYIKVYNLSVESFEIEKRQT